MSSLGKIGEDLAADYYKNLGFKIVGRNYFFPHGKQTGELDLICIKDRQIVFVEVKTRSSMAFGSPFEAVDRTKQRHIIKTAKMFILQHPQYRDFDLQIDIAAVDIDNKLEPVIIVSNAIEDEY